MAAAPKTLKQNRLYKQVASNLRAVRVFLKYSIDDVVQATGLSKSRISEMENQQSCLNLYMLDSLADFYGVSLDYMVGRSNDPCELRSAGTYVTYFKQVLEGHMNAIAVMSASAMVNSREGAGTASEFNNACTETIAAFDRFVALNLAFEEDMAGGARLNDQINRLRALVKQHQQVQTRLQISKDPNDWIRSLGVTKQFLSQMDGGLNDDGMALVNRSLATVAQQTNPNHSLSD